MPRTRSLAWSELKVGILTVVALVIIALTIFALTGNRGFFWQRYSLKSRFDNIAGLKEGSPVRIAGVEVGSVTGVEFVGERVDVTFELNKSHRERITTASTAKLGSVSLLGESAVDLTPATAGTPIPEWGYVPQGRPTAVLADVTDQASQGVEELTKLLQDVRAGRGTVGKLVTDDQLYADLTRFVATAGDVTRGIQQGEGTLGKLAKDPKAAQALEASLTNLEAMTRQINSGEGSIGRLLKDETFSRTLTSATANLNELTGKVSRGEGTAGKLITDPSLFNRLNAVGDQFDQLLSRLNEGQGTAGQLLKDRQLYENMNGAVTDLRMLVADIRREPRKYLNVKVSIF
jgi:phospholipid/cholesterol/gamma-HCH transport system substrate-binding protein